MKFLLSLIVAFTTTGPIDRAAWLLGTWSGGRPGKELVEIWEKQDDSTYLGRGCMVKGRDTVVQESVSLQERNGQLYYIPTVAGQNDGRAVRFTLTAISDRHMVFENPAHDFPQKITYTLIHPDSLLAEISGKIQGEIKSRGYPMRRVK
jgi:hypothetical protein